MRAPSRIAWTAIGLAAMILVVASFGVTIVALRSGSSSSDGLPGDLTFGACSASGCTVNASVRNTVSATAGQVHQAAISAEMTVSLTGDGSPAGSCTAKSLLTPGAETTMSCTVVDPGLAAYFRRVDTVAGQHLLNANGEVYAHAVATVEVGQIISRLQRDAQTVRYARPGASADPNC